MKSEWATGAAVNFIDFNPKLKISKGTMATKIAMDKLLPFTKKIGNTEKAEYTGGAKFCNGDTIMARITPCLENGKTAFVDVLKDKEIAFGSTEFLVLRAKKGISDPHYVYYIATSPNFRKVAIQSMVGSSGRQRVQQEVVENLQLKIPHIDLQRKIGNFLTLFDRKIELNLSLIDKLHALLRSLFKSRVALKNEELKQAPLSQLCSVITKGTTPTTLGMPFVNQGINFVKAESIVDSHFFVEDKFAHIDLATHTLLKRSILNENDILFTIAGTLGRYAIVDKDILPANTNQAVAIIRADRTRITPEYLYSCFIGNWHIDYYTKRIQQSVQANLSLSTIKTLSIPILNEFEMEKYLELITPLVALIKNARRENMRLSGLRDTLLPKLLSGEIDVSNISLDI